MKSHYEYQAIVTRVVDGDTLEVTIDLGFRIKIEKVRLRLKGIDTPETWRPRNDLERTHGLKATEFVEGIFNRNPNCIITTFKHGPSSFARYEADVRYHDAQGSLRDLVTDLKEANLEKLSDYAD